MKHFFIQAHDGHIFAATLLDNGNLQYTNEHACQGVILTERFMELIVRDWREYFRTMFAPVK
mgnify:CR=1 FL=1